VGASRESLGIHTRAIATKSAGLLMLVPAKVGVLFSGPRGSAAVDAFIKAMEHLGYRDGSSITLDFRYAEGRPDRLMTLARELASQAPKLIAAISAESVIAAAQATSTIPIVSATGDVDFIGCGLTTSLERPDGNVTGVTISAGEAARRRIELLKKAVPGTSLVAVLIQRDLASNARLLDSMQAASERLGLTLFPEAVSDLDDLEAVVRNATNRQMSAICTLQGPFFYFRRKCLVAACARHAMPLAMSEPGSADAGALIQVNADVLGAATASVDFIDRLLKGAKPSDLPIERYSGIEVVLNMRAALGLGLNVDRGIAGSGRVLE
jgi:putative tryptophan/tyrosine transport system substrate-binding protein